jgi:hypothetical protein
MHNAAASIITQKITVATTIKAIPTGSILVSPWPVSIA